MKVGDLVRVSKKYDDTDLFFGIHGIVVETLKPMSEWGLFGGKQTECARVMIDSIKRGKTKIILFSQEDLEGLDESR